MFTLSITQQPSFNYTLHTGIFTIVVPKESPGETFEGLDMLTSLLTPKSQKLKKPVIEVIKKGIN